MTAAEQAQVFESGLLFRAPKDPDSHERYDGGDAFTTILRAGYRRSPENRAFESPTVYEKDVRIPLRDGTILRADVFRPESSPRIPAILPWSPYGKSGRGKTTAHYKLVICSMV